MAPPCPPPWFVVLRLWSRLRRCWPSAAAARPRSSTTEVRPSFKQDKLEPAVSDLESFVGKSCGPTGEHAHCRQAYLTLGHAYEKREAPGKAWAAYDSALTFGPHSADEAIQSDRDRMRDAPRRAATEGDGARARSSFATATR